MFHLALITLLLKITISAVVACPDNVGNVYTFVITTNTDTLAQGCPFDPGSTFKFTLGNGVTKIPDNFLAQTTTGALEIGTLEINNKIQEIGDNAFAYCTINTLDISDATGLTSIGSGAFQHCQITSIGNFEKLKLQSIPDHLFDSASFPTDLKLPKTITEVGNSAFESNSNSAKTIYLTNLENLKYVGDRAFYNQHLRYWDLESTSQYNGFDIDQKHPLVFPEELEQIGNEAFVTYSQYNYYMEITSLENAVKIGDNAYLGHEVHIPSIINCPNLKYIGDNAFCQIYPVPDQGKVLYYQLYEYSRINQITFGNTDDFIIEKIGANAFRNQDTLEIKSNTLRARQIGNKAFYLCKQINKNIEIIPVGNQAGKYCIGENAFYGCTKLAGTLTIKPVTNDDEEKNFVYPQINSYAFQNSGIQYIDFPQLNSIGTSAFENCQELKGKRNPALNLICDEIGEKAFKDCTKLSLSSITTNGIDSSAFENCQSLGANIQINEGGNIGPYAFYGCTTLGTLDYLDNFILDNGKYNPAQIGEHAFANSGLKGELKIKYFINEIGSYAFANCNKLNTLKILSENNNRLEIKDHAFYNSKIGSKIEIPDSVSLIDQKAFSYTQISSVTIEGFRYLDEDSKVESDVKTIISNDAFDFCTYLETLTFGKGQIDYDNDGKKLSYKFKGTKIKNINLGEIGIIEDDAFSGMTSLQTVTIPRTVEEIGARAFAGCTNIKVTIEPNSELNTIGEGAFSDCTNLNLGSLPVGVSEIKPYTFYKCGNLVLNKLPEKVSAIGDFAFYDCNSLELDLNGLYELQTIGKSAFQKAKLSKSDIEFLNKLTTVDEKAFYENLNLNGKLAFGPSITSIKKYAFCGCRGLTELIFPETINNKGTLTIEESAFDGCSGINKKLKLPNKVNLQDSQYAFRNCPFNGELDLRNAIVYSGSTKYALSKGIFYGCRGFNGNLLLPTQLTTIPEEAFYQCSGLNGQLQLQQVTNIGKKAFYGCSGFTGTLQFPKITTIGESAFNGCTRLNKFEFLTSPYSDQYGLHQNIVGKDAFGGCTGFNSVNLENLNSIPEYAFANCANIQSLSLPSSITTIPSHAFFGCTGLAGNLDCRYVQSIHQYAFTNCTALTGVQFESIEYIGKYAFYGCTGLTGNLEFSNSLTEIGEYAFYGCAGLTGPLHFSSSLTRIGEYAFSGCKSFSEHLSFLVGTLSIEQRAFQGCTGFSGGRLTITINEYEEDSGSSGNYYRYGYFLKIANEAFEETDFEDVYYIGRFDPDCDFNTGLSNGIHASTNYANKTFCHKKVKGKGGLSGGAIAGIVIACVVVVAAIVFLVVFFLCIKGKGGSRSEDEVEMNQNP